MWASVTVVKTLLKINHADGFKLNGVGALQTRVCKWIEVEILWSSGMPTWCDAPDPAPDVGVERGCHPS